MHPRDHLADEQRAVVRGASPGFLLFDDEGHEVHGVDNRALFVREVVAWVHGHLSDPVEQTA